MSQATALCWNGSDKVRFSEKFHMHYLHTQDILISDPTLTEKLIIYDQIFTPPGSKHPKSIRLGK